MDKVLKNDHTEETLFEVAEFFKVLGDHTRIKIVSALFENGELCVNDIVDLVDVSRNGGISSIENFKRQTDYQLSQRGTDETSLKNYFEIPGKGTRVEVVGRTILVENRSLLRERQIDLIENEEEGTIVYLATDGQLTGYLVLGGTL